MLRAIAGLRVSPGHSPLLTTACDTLFRCPPPSTVSAQQAPKKAVKELDEDDIAYQREYQMEDNRGGSVARRRMAPSFGMALCRGGGSVRTVCTVARPARPVQLELQGHQGMVGGDGIGRLGTVVTGLQ